METDKFFSSGVILQKTFQLTDIVTLPNNGEIYYLLKTPTIELCEFHLNVEFQKEGILYMYEGGTVSNNGSALVAKCAHRTLDPLPKVLTYKSPTIVTTGSQCCIVPKGNTINFGGDLIEDDLELFLKKNTNYIFKVINQSALPSWFNFKVKWLEHPD